MVVKNIEALCKKRGISIARLEREAGIGNGVIRRWDEGNPRLDCIKRIADYFGVTIDELLQD